MMALPSILGPCPSKATKQKQRPINKNYSVNIKGHKVKINMPPIVCVIYIIHVHKFCAFGGHKRGSASLQPELQAVVCILMWVLGVKLWTLCKSRRALNHGAISLAPLLTFPDSVFHQMWISSASWLGWLAHTPKRSSHLFFPQHWIRCLPLCPDLYVGAGHPNSGPLVCIADAFLPEASP